MLKFDTDGMRSAFKIWHTESDNDTNFEQPEHSAFSIHGWGVSDAGRHENKKGIYLSVMFGHVEEAERRLVTIALTRKQLQALIDEVDNRFIEVGTDGE